MKLCSRTRQSVIWTCGSVSAVTRPSTASIKFLSRTANDDVVDTTTATTAELTTQNLAESDPTVGRPLTKSSSKTLLYYIRYNCTEPNSQLNLLYVMLTYKQFYGHFSTFIYRHEIAAKPISVPVATASEDSTNNCLIFIIEWIFFAAAEKSAIENHNTQNNNYL